MVSSLIRSRALESSTWCPWLDASSKGSKSSRIWMYHCATLQCLTRSIMIGSWNISWTTLLQISWRILLKCPALSSQMWNLHSLTWKRSHPPQLWSAWLSTRCGSLSSRCVLIFVGWSDLGMFWVWGISIYFALPSLQPNLSLFACLPGGQWACHDCHSRWLGEEMVGS